MSYFHWKYNQLSSALRRFTVLFGMGRSGTAPLWSPGKALEFFANETKRVAIAWIHAFSPTTFKGHQASRL